MKYSYIISHRLALTIRLEYIYTAEVLFSTGVINTCSLFVFFPDLVKECPAFDVHVAVHCAKFLVIKPTRRTNFSNLFLEWNYVFQTVHLPIIRILSVYTQQWYMSYRFADSLRAGSGWNCSSILILLASCPQTCMTYTIAVCTVNDSWWWTEEQSETCRVLFQE